MGGDPDVVHGADPVVDPDKGSAVGPLGKVAGLPVQAARTVVGTRLQPLHDEQPWRPEAGGDSLI